MASDHLSERRDSDFGSWNGASGRILQELDYDSDGDAIFLLKKYWALRWVRDSRRAVGRARRNLERYLGEQGIRTASRPDERGDRDG